MEDGPWVAWPFQARGPGYTDFHELPVAVRQSV